MNTLSNLTDKRIALIHELEKGKIDKTEFILENFEMLKSYTPSNYNVNSIEEGIVKYHYFNTAAKKLMIEADELEFRDPRESGRLKENAYDLYVKKDKITLAFLEHVNFEDIEAYFINLNSKYLEGVIYEIQFKSLDKVILHSKDKRILYKLKTAGCFSEVPKKSAICSYVNTKL